MDSLRDAAKQVDAVGSSASHVLRSTSNKGNVFDLGIGAEWFESCASYVPELDKENRGPSPKRKRLHLKLKKKVPVSDRKPYCCWSYFLWNTK